MLEINDQLFRCREHIGTFFSIKMPMVALSNFIVVAQNTFATYDVRKPVFEFV